MKVYFGFPQDIISNDSITMSTLRNANVEKSSVFQAFYKTTISAGATLYLAFKTPEEKQIRAYPTVLNTSSDKLTMKYREGAVIEGGTLDLAFNQDRNSDKESEVVLTANPTVIENGIQVAQVFLGGGTGSGQSRSGAQGGGGDTFWKLKPDTTYLFEFVNDSSLDNTIQINEIWIEGD